MTGIDKRHCLKGGDDMTGHVTAVEIEAEDRDVRIEWGVGLDGSRLRLLTRSGHDAHHEPGPLRDSSKSGWGQHATHIDILPRLGCGGRADRPMIGPAEAVKG